VGSGGQSEPSRALEHDPEKCVAVSRLREARGDVYRVADASAGEGRSEKIMLKQRS
jgi:hypothetical protein